jgi:hypothetical protein
MCPKCRDGEERWAVGEDNDRSPYNNSTPVCLPNQNNIMFFLIQFHGYCNLPRESISAYFPAFPVGSALSVSAGAGK